MPAIVVRKYRGTAILRRGVLKPAAAAAWFERLEKTLPWHVRKIHGNVDRTIWDGTVANKVTPEAGEAVGELKEQLEAALDLELGPDSFGNHYRTAADRTFWHLDHDINPGDVIHVVSFGGARMLTFVDLVTQESYDFEVGDGDVV